MNTNAQWIAQADANYVTTTTATITLSMALVGMIWNDKTRTYTKPRTNAQRAQLAKILG